MKLITKNFQLNALANSYAAAIYEHLRHENGGDHFHIYAGEIEVKVQIIDGQKGVREIIDAYFLEAMQLTFKGWESTAITLFEKCLLNGSRVTPKGIQIWGSMLKDMGSTVAGNWEKSK